jgi:hypothetical protein
MDKDSTELAEKIWKKAPYMVMNFQTGFYWVNTKRMRYDIEQARKR